MTVGIKTTILGHVTSGVQVECVCYIAQGDSYQGGLEEWKDEVQQAPIRCKLMC